METTRNDLDQCRIHIQEMVDQKRWIDWLGKFQEVYHDVDRLSPHDRKEYLEGVIDNLVVNLDPKTNEHGIDINFKFPIVGHRLEYDEESDRSKGYEVIERDTTQVIRGTFVSRHDRVKKEQR